MRNNKKAFTIVELIIVIVIIGILAAILIPNLVRYIDKAHVTKDMELVRNLNTALTVDTKEHYTMTEALDAAEEFGYNVGKINRSKVGNEILWDSVNDVFCYFNSESTSERKIEYIPEAPKKVNDVKDHEYFVIKDVNSLSDIDEKYSTYIRVLNSLVTTITTDKGLDTGETAPELVKYVRDAEDAQTVVIRTNSVVTEVEINSSTDTVKHYGKAGSVNVKKVASNSYHEFGQVPFIKTANGRVALENGSKVEHIHLAATGEGAQAHFDGIIVAKDESVEMPNFSRDSVEIPNAGRLVVALQEGTEEITETTDLDYIWLTKQGIFEQIAVSDNADTATLKDSEEKVWADDEGTSEKTQTAAQQIANNIGRDINNNIDVKLTVTKETVSKTYKVTLDENRDLIVVDQADELETRVASISESGTISVNDVEFTIELATEDNQMNLVATNVANEEEQYVETVLEDAGLSTEEIDNIKDETITDAVEFTIAFEHEEYVIEVDSNNLYVDLQVQPILTATDPAFYADFAETAVWTSSNTEVAVVVDGVVSGVFGGTASIMVTYHGVYASFEVTVPVLAEPFTVTFDTKYYNVTVEDQEFTQPGKVTQPADLVKEGYLFRGWFANAELTIPFDFENTTVSEDTTIYALWRVPVGGTIYYIHEEALGTYTFYKGSSVTNCVVTENSADFAVGQGGNLDLFVEVTDKPVDAVDKYFVYDNTNGAIYNPNSRSTGCMQAPTQFGYGGDLYKLNGYRELGDGKKAIWQAFNRATGTVINRSYNSGTLVVRPLESYSGIRDDESYNDHNHNTTWAYIDFINNFGNLTSSDYTGATLYKDKTQKPQYCDEWYIGSLAELMQLRSYTSFNINAPAWSKPQGGSMISCGQNGMNGYGIRWWNDSTYTEGNIETWNFSAANMCEGIAVAIRSF